MELREIFKNKNRGYCKACKYYYSYNKVCSNTKLATGVDKTWESYTYIIPPPSQLNKNNNCSGWKQGFFPCL